MNFETGDYKEIPDPELSFIEETPLQTLQNAGLIESDKPKSFTLNPENEKLTRLPNFFELIQIN